MAARDCTRRLLLAVAALCVGSVGIALVSQHVFGMLPCPWCTFQRLLYLVVALLALLAALPPAGTARRLLTALAALTAVGGVAAAWWQQFHAAQDASCTLTLADRIMKQLGLFEVAPAVFAPMASCADAEVLLLGVPYAIWSLLLFATLALLLSWLALRKPVCRDFLFMR